MKRIACLLALAAVCAAQDHSGWRDYGGAPDSAQYSALRQINRANVSKLEIAWTYPTGDTAKYSFNPIMVDGVVYVLAKKNSIVALDARTGKEIWVHTPDPPASLITYRGINYWESKDRSDRRLLFCANHALQAIDARTGKSILSFGTGGSVDLKEGLGRDPQVAQAGAIDYARQGVREPADFGLRDQPGVRFGAWRYPGLRRAHRQTGMDVPHHSAPRRVRL